MGPEAPVTIQSCSIGQWMAKRAPSIFGSSQRPVFITSHPQPEVHRGNIFWRHRYGGVRNSRHSMCTCASDVCIWGDWREGRREAQPLQGIGTWSQFSASQCGPAGNLRWETPSRNLEPSITKANILAWHLIYFHVLCKTRCFLSTCSHSQVCQSLFLHLTCLCDQLAFANSLLSLTPKNHLAPSSPLRLIQPPLSSVPVYHNVPRWCS